MTVLEQVRQMQERGMQENEIISSLQEQGISPKEITDVIGQANIKKAISETPEGQTQTQEYTPNIQEQQYYQQEQPQYQEYSDQSYNPMQGYDNYATPSGNTDTMIEISEQVFAEKIKKIQKQVETINEFKIISETKIQNISERLQKIEKTIDNLQLKILDKVGSYGTNLDSIKKEMSMMQDSFRKIANTKTTTKKASKK